MPEKNTNPTVARVLIRCREHSPAWDCPTSVLLAQSPVCFSQNDHVSAAPRLQPVLKKIIAFLRYSSDVVANSSKTWPHGHASRWLAGHLALSRRMRNATGSQRSSTPPLSSIPRASRQLSSVPGPAISSFTTSTPCWFSGWWPLSSEFRLRRDYQDRGGAVANPRVCRYSFVVMIMVSLHRPGDLGPPRLGP